MAYLSIRKSWSFRDHGGFLAIIVDLHGGRASSQMRRGRGEDERRGGVKTRGKEEGGVKTIISHHRWSKALIISCLRGMVSASRTISSTSVVI